MYSGQRRAAKMWGRIKDGDVIIRGILPKRSMFISVASVSRNMMIVI